MPGVPIPIGLPDPRVRAEWTVRLIRDEVEYRVRPVAEHNWA